MSNVMKIALGQLQVRQRRREARWRAMCACEVAEREAAAEQAREQEELYNSFLRLFKQRRAWLKKDAARWEEERVRMIKLRSEMSQ